MSTIRITLKSFDYSSLESCVQSILTIARNTGSVCSGPVCLPVDIKRVTVLTSPHIYKDARDQFETRTYKQLIDIIDPTENTIDGLVKLELSAGVEAKIDVISEE